MTNNLSDEYQILPNGIIIENVSIIDYKRHVASLLATHLRDEIDEAIMEMYLNNADE